MNDLHEPSPEFLSHLEWQTRTELRRRERFAPVPLRMPRLMRVARSAALVLVSLTVGASAVLAVGRLQDSRELGIRLERNRVLVELAERRVESAQERLEMQRVRYEQGLSPLGGVGEAERRFAGSVVERDHLRLDREELNSARRAPDLRLSAPLVGPRDFVSEHLRLDKSHSARLVELFDADEQVAELRFAQGLISHGEAERASRETELAVAALERLDERLALRADFLLERLDAATCELRDLVTGAEHRRRVLTGEVESLARELLRAEALEAAGRAAGAAEPLRAELDALAVELQLIDLELELLR